ncbi:MULTISPECIES: hypothetical protein [Arcicella]|uniref:Uncharacterized protein n=1 Tax=Arcicella aquatica TaxID=217141 RepID=A0ABU5QPG6_9BACT|nr:MULTISPECIES: hypothetical protein [Arcicella]MDR6564474.1 hypothetical protein [Arcicella sp. BE51]MDR6814333.1 hypothetical protein [Arcicella sp. BE140]MDR6825645.1 hypothetical protein [Arcicella sp. BE139]MEA5258574.1 hypothetical protein [Arcicella aquatica]
MRHSLAIFQRYDWRDFQAKKNATRKYANNKKAPEVAHPEHDKVSFDWIN